MGDSAKGDTWAAPAPGVIGWYQPSDATGAGGFVSKLDAALQERGSPARCWAYVTHANQFFHWANGRWTKAALQILKTVCLHLSTCP